MPDPTDLHELITSIQDGPETIQLEESRSPYLGLFYVIGEKLYWEGVPLENAQDSLCKAGKRSRWESEIEKLTSD